MKLRNPGALFATVMFALIVTCTNSRAQSWNAWPRDAGWGTVPFFGLGFNWRRPYLPTPSYGLHPYGVVEPRYVVSPEEIASCARRFRSYDPISGTYVGRDGFRYFCP